MVGVRVGAHNGFDMASATVGMGTSLPDAAHVRVVGRAGVDDDVAGGRLAHQVGVGAGPGHKAGVGRGQAAHMARQRHRRFVLPGRGGRGFQQRTVGERLCRTDHGRHCAAPYSDRISDFDRANQRDGNWCDTRVTTKGGGEKFSNNRT